MSESLISRSLKKGALLKVDELGVGFYPSSSKDERELVRVDPKEILVYLGLATSDWGQIYNKTQTQNEEFWALVLMSGQIGEVFTGSLKLIEPNK